jgi:toxin CcdB
MLQQFDICRVSGAQAEFAVVLQHSYLLDQATCIVAPMLRSDIYKKAGKLHPIVDLNDTSYVVAMELLSSVPRRSLTPRVGTALQKADDIKAALDLLFIGF